MNESHRASSHEPESLSPSIDRNKPIVARNPRWKGIAIGSTIIATLVLVGGMALSGTKPDETALEASNEETFRVDTAKGGKPYIAPPPKEAPHQPAIQAKGKSDYDPVAAQRMAMLQQQALLKAQEHEKKLKDRLYSNQLVIDNPSSNRHATMQNLSANSSAINTSGGTLLSGTTDENLEFANQHRNADIETVGAVQLHNLHGLIPQGTMISGILETAIQSNLPGMVRAIVSEDTYSFDKANLLIPSGSALVGQYRSSVQQGQSRVFVIWDRLIRPDGVSINLASFGTDSLGRSGLEGEVDTHFMERFGSSIMLSLIDAGIRVGVEAADNKDNATVAVDTGDDFSRASEIALNNSINIPPTIHVDQGERIKVFVGRDLDFSTVKQTAWRE